MKSLNLFIVLSCFLILISCERIFSPVDIERKRALTPDEKAIIDAGNSFGAKFFREAAVTSVDSNIFVSPLSVSMALGMTLNGARGDTRDAMVQTLELEGLTQKEINESYQSLIRLLLGLDPKVTFGIANSIWCREGISFKQNFLDLNREYFDARVQSLNFSDPQTLVTINQWVSVHTSGRIRKILQSLNPEDIMVLLNAIYFKGDWTYQFNPEETKEDDFFISPGNIVRADFMFQTNDFNYLDGDAFQAVDLPYGNGDFRMAVILPDANVDINQFISSLPGKKLSDILQSFTVTKGTIALPRFQIEYSLELKKLLSLMGMGIAFDPFQADFRDLYEGSENAYISRVKHKTFLKVDEEGTEAAAATAVVISFTSTGNSSFFMKVDRPFVLLIYDKFSHTLLFTGKICNPERID